MNYKPYNNIVFFFFTLMISTGCLENNKSTLRSQIDKPSTNYRNHTISLDSLKLSGKDSNSNHYKIFVNIDGNCSSCIQLFLTVSQQMRKLKHKNEITFYYIVYASDPYTLEYFMDERGIKLLPNEIIVLDKVRNFEKNNSFLPKDATSIVLTDSQFHIIEIGNPFQTMLVRKNYQKRGLL